MRLPPAIIPHTEELLREVLRFTGPADVTLSRYFRDNPRLGSRERGVIAEAVYGLLRNKTVLTNFAESGSGPMMRRLALLGLADAVGAESIAGLQEGEADWLERVAQIDRTQLAAQMRSNLPPWLWDKLVARMGEAATLELAEAMNRPAPLDLRVNALKADRDTVIAELAKAPVACEPTPYSPLGLRVLKKPALQNLPLFKDGAIEVQDEGSQLLAQIVGAKRGEMVVDFCAGAGGKTLALGALMRNTGRLYAFDVSEKRLAKLKPRLARSGLSNVHPVVIAHENDAKVKRLAGKLDRVLVDAPCSGLGTLRRNPDMKWRQTVETLAEMRAKQSSILASAARLVRAGGRLVYGTCSFLEEENDEVIADFLQSHPDFILRPMGEVLAEQKIALEMGDYLKLLPHQHQTDGFFAAVLERRAA
ncbi:RsmB/NOP family class I SAM-dependent RNA methyltransferase [Herbaspirillum seropedicae]|uniref:tRNA and rRNA cytosine-C5-methylase protein n=1 Tax=Herbaspirillum seropedicae (strain SmR1) TaxID=757424 RepID=D8J1S4_HERSS|nr:RsmB/NOP family class I SAM-dependent RNA methyltransferase [Herbaspirillum seropedicae]ADJ62695.1 tRNA and rRNA cytosine-C5-methylase protein [Herbaspirillum seropedicae SmR1]AKN64801.1 SAM-dependent methyltransferase [Herbaspirillum seropedicae]AON53418.1 tRNA and rRNA cytosine-C5-methylase [Herbaspirillum seropedicae]MDR6396491.1 16S rRNA (cytosine967-C5)-methyltransferase [Herbaspirillum seropedicae]NQE31695.1 SAM-dependent methyltransferase [Herbaspirillum seropedicae]